MQIITVFDYNSYPYKPLISAITYKGKSRVFPLYLKGTGKSLWQVHNSIKSISDILKKYNDPIIMNDVKSHVRAFGDFGTNSYQTNINMPQGLSFDKYEKLLGHLKDLNTDQDEWRNIAANCSQAYITMEDKLIFLGEERVHPIYGLDTYSGRSKCTNFNMQGTSENDDIRLDDTSELFVCFDWISADIRVAAFMSDDKELNKSFVKSDPYAELSRLLDLPRNQCKLIFLKSFYSLDIDSPIFQLFPDFQIWAGNQLRDLNENGYLASALDRKFTLNPDDSRDERSVFNAVIQGTVAHAMQASLIKIMENTSRYLVSETHDSIVMACRPPLIPHLVNEVSNIMVKPLDDLPRFPLKVYIGKKWKKWKFYREFR